MNASYTLGTFVIVLTLSIGACKNSEPASNETAGLSQDNLSQKEALYWARKDSAKMQFTQADANFMSGMIGHHAQALVMSRLAPEHASSQSLKTLAKRIINSQNDEIETMQQWLRERNQPVPEIEIDGLKLTIDGMLSGHMKMAGMLTQEQLEELGRTYGPEFDQLFLKYMIGHHTGALIMVKKLIEQDGAAQEEAAFKLASDINVDQKTEIARMHRMLDKLTETSN